jgi:preprotein translocase subunit SecG
MQVLNIFHVLIAIALVAFVLIQKGQGATAGAAFGSGASGTVFGSRGAGNFLSRTTWVLATLFCAISLTMAVIVSRTVGVPETNLGVLGTTQAAPEVNNSVISVGSDETPGSDLPSFDNADGSTADGEANLINNTVEDLPALDPALNQAIENEVIGESQAVEESLGGEESTSDDS